MRLLDPRPRRPARAALLGLLLCALLPAGSARPAAPDADAAAFLGRLEAAWQARDLAGWLALWDFASPEQKAFEEETAPRPPSRRTRRPHLPAAAEPRRGGDALRRRRAGLRGDRAAGAGLLLASPGREARGALGDRGPAGRGPDRRPRPPLARPAAWRARGVSLRLEDFELRMEDGTLFTTPEDARPDGLRLRGPRAASASPPPRPPSASSSASSRASRRSTARSAGPSSACTLPTSTARSRRASSSRRRTRARGAPRRSACGATAPSAASSIDAPLPRSPWWLMPSPGRRDGGLPLGPQAGPDLRALLGRARGREPLRPRPAPPDLHLPLGGPGARATARTTAGWWTCWTTTSRRVSTPSGSRCSPRTPCACGCWRRPARCACGCTTTSASRR